MKTLFAILLATAFAVGPVSAHCGKCEGDKKDGCSEKAKKDGDCKDKSDCKKDEKKDDKK